MGGSRRAQVLLGDCTPSDPGHLSHTGARVVSGAHASALTQECRLTEDWKVRGPHITFWK